MNSDYERNKYRFSQKTIQLLIIGFRTSFKLPPNAEYCIELTLPNSNLRSRFRPASCFQNVVNLNERFLLTVSNTLTNYLRIKLFSRNQNVEREQATVLAPYSERSQYTRFQFSMHGQTPGYMLISMHAYLPEQILRNQHQLQKSRVADEKGSHRASTDINSHAQEMDKDRREADLMYRMPHLFPQKLKVKPNKDISYSFIYSPQDDTHFKKCQSQINPPSWHNFKSSQSLVVRSNKNQDSRMRMPPPSMATLDVPKTGLMGLWGLRKTDSQQSISIESSADERREINPQAASEETKLTQKMSAQTEVGKSSQSNQLEDIASILHTCNGNLSNDLLKISAYISKLKSSHEQKEKQYMQQLTIANNRIKQLEEQLSRKPATTKTSLQDFEPQMPILRLCFGTNLNDNIKRSYRKVQYFLTHPRGKMNQQPIKSQ